MYYLFGAGSNCLSVIGFVGKENIKGIIDNNASKEGKVFCGCPVMCFDNFMKQYRGETIIISTSACKNEVKKQLYDNNILEFLVFPNLQTSYWSAEKIINHWELYKYKTICLISDSVISSIFSNIILEHSENIDNFYILEEFDQKEWKSILDSTDIILVMKEIISEEEQIFLQNRINVVWINKEIRYQLQKKYDGLKKYKDKYKGRKCFVIGNGPSLKYEDLERIGNNHIVSFGSNRIFEIYETTWWRPNYYVASDGLVPMMYMDSIMKYDVPVFMKDFVGFDSDMVSETFRYQENDYNEPLPRFSDDISKCIYRSATVTNDILQIAVYMGFNEIYLLGVDCNYIQGSYSNYFNNTKEPDTAIHRTDNMVLAFESAKRYTEMNGVKVYNATRGGKLEVFERVDFDSLFER